MLKPRNWSDLLVFGIAVTKAVLITPVWHQDNSMLLPLLLTGSSLQLHAT